MIQTQNGYSDEEYILFHTDEFDIVFQNGELYLKNNKDENIKLVSKICRDEVYYEIKLRNVSKRMKLSIGYKYKGYLFGLKIDNKNEYPLIHSCLLTDLSEEMNYLEIIFSKKNQPLEFEKLDLRDYATTRGYDRIIYHNNEYIIPLIDGSKTIDLELTLEDEWEMINIKLNV